MDSEWVLMYTGRPSGSRPKPESPTSRVERERKEAMDYLDANSHMTLEELAADNYQKQSDKELEYHRLKNRKCPTLEEQEVGPDGRFIFSQEYIDFMLYRELQPLIDLRILRHGEAIINERKAERDAAAKGTTVTEVQRHHKLTFYKRFSDKCKRWKRFITQFFSKEPSTSSSSTA